MQFLKQLSQIVGAPIKMASKKDIVYQLFFHNGFSTVFFIISICTDRETGKDYCQYRKFEVAKNENSKKIIIDEWLSDDTMTLFVLLKESGKREITLEQWKKFHNLVFGSYFWSLSNFENSNHAMGGFDGEEVMIEGWEYRDYHFVRRHIPNEGSFKELCKIFFEFADLKVDDF